MKTRKCRSKTCRHKRPQPIANFGRDKSGQDGINGICKECIGKYSRERYKRVNTDDTVVGESPRLKKRDKSQLHTDVDWEKVMETDLSKSEY